MASTVQALNQFTQLAAVRVVAASNQSGTYYNGPLNNGIGATFTYATGVLTIDSVDIVKGNFVLFGAQTAGYMNGIYECIVEGAVGVAAVLQRRGDLQSMEQIQLGAFVPVYAGSTYGGSVWQLVEPLPKAIGNPVVANSNDINFATITATGSSLFLAKASNLSDVANVNSSRNNLNLGDDVISYTTATLTAAQFNGMYAAPVLLVAAPGANKLIVVERMALVMTYGAANFAAGGVVAAQYDSTVHGAGVLATNTEAAADFFAAASTTFAFNGNAGNTVGIMPFTTTVNKGLYLSNQTGAFTTGDSTFVVHVWYKIIPTA